VSTPLPHILIVLTSHAELGTTGRKTGFWLDELAAPYYLFRDAGATVTLASPKGGQPPIDPTSDEEGTQSATTLRFKADASAQAALAATLPLRSMNAMQFDAVFYPGGHGPLWDLANDQDSIRLIETMLREGKPVAAVCHAPAVLRDVRHPDGRSILDGKAVTGFTNSEESAAGLLDAVPFLVEDMLREKGGMFSRRGDWRAHVVSDGLLITGQNPSSAGPAARVLLELLGEPVLPTGAPVAGRASGELPIGL
jgi:putative intracellular protease/amidase